MATKVPYINPIRIRKVGTGSEIDYDDVFPRFDLITQRVQYQRGVIDVSVYPDFLVNKQLQLEVYDSTNVTIAVAVNLDTGGTTNITPVDITPSGWTGEKIYTISFTPNVEGLYVINIIAVGGDFKTDEFVVKSGSTDKDLIKITYSDSQNRLEYGGGFYSGDSGNWSPTAYFTGIKRKIVSAREDSVYIDEPGNPVTLQSTGSKSEQIILTDIHESYVDVIEEIVKVDTLYINGQLMTVSDLTSDPIDENSDVVNITMTITRADNDGYFNYD